MRIFASDRVKNFMKALGMQSGEAIEHRMVTNAIEKAQRKVEGRNFDIRKQLLEFDDVNNEQRKVIYHMRNTLLAADNIGDTIADFRQDVLNATVSQHIPPQSLPEQWDVAGLEASLASDFAMKLPIQQWLDEDDHLYEETLREKLMPRSPRLQRERRPGRRRSAAYLREADRAARAGRPVERPPVDHGPPASRHPPARLCAEEPEAGVQARVVHAVPELLDSIKRDTIRVLSHVQVRREDPVEEEARLRREAEDWPAACSSSTPKPRAWKASKWRRGRCGPGRRAGAQRAEAGPQRAVLVRFGQEIQALPRADQ
jgi:preprotein translocase subunit SecA